MTTGKTTALTRRTFVGKVMSLLSNMLSRLVITFLPRRKRLLISWLHSPSAVILEPKKIKPVTVSIAFPSICYEVLGPDATILAFWAFSSPLSPSSRGSLVPFKHMHLCVMCMCVYTFLRYEEQSGVGSIMTYVAYLLELNFLSKVHSLDF